MCVIKVENVHKKFKVYFDKGQSFKERILFRNRSRYEDRWVLRGINLNVEKGEALGLIGHNGCGKSTLLKLLSKIIYPDSGSIEITGRVSSLIELGAGFHPDMSGRENIYTNAAIFGMTKREIDKRLNKIIAFSELEEFIDNPVRTYSSGMYMRLAFSVAINVDADILLIDEILAVGDTNFQAKCFDKLRELKASGVTIILVTHDTHTVETFCNKAVWINDGVVLSYGSSAEVVDKYLDFMNTKKYDDMIVREENMSKVQEDEIHEENEAETKEDGESVSNTVVENSESGEENISDVGKADEIDYNANRFGLKFIEIVKAEMFNQDHVKTSIFKAGESVEIDIHYKVNKKLDEYVFGMGFYTLDNVCIIGTNTQIDRLIIPHTKKQGIIKFKTNNLPLISGKYILQVAVVDRNGTPMDFYRDYSHFDVISPERSVGIISLKHEWEIE